MIKRILERSKLSNRTDDNIVTLEKRFLTFEKETKPIIEHYEKLGKSIEVLTILLKLNNFKIDANSNIDEVYLQLKSKIIHQLRGS